MLSKDGLLVITTLVIFSASTALAFFAYDYLLKVEGTWTNQQANRFLLFLTGWLVGMFVSSVMTAACKLNKQKKSTKIVFLVILIVNWILLGLMFLIDFSGPPPDQTLSGAIFGIMYPVLTFAPLILLSTQIGNGFRNR